MGCGPSTLRKGEAQAIKEQTRRGEGNFQKVALDRVLPKGMVPIRKVQPRESDSATKLDDDGTLSQHASPTQHDLRSGSSLPWVADEGNTVVMIDTIELLCDGVSRTSLFSRPDTYLTISCSSNTEQVFTTPVRKEELATAEWAVRVPLLVRADTDDIITIQGISSRCVSLKVPPDPGPFHLLKLLVGRLVGWCNSWLCLTGTTTVTLVVFTKSRG
jgi:hypothetical protein